MKWREAEGGIEWKMKNQKLKKEIVTQSNLERKEDY